MTSVLITGGTGSFGQAYTRSALDAGAERVVVYSRDELKQYNMARTIPKKDMPRVRFFIGDVRDADRLTRACDGVSTIIHAAAMKQVPACEYNPGEAVKTNVGGAMSVIAAALATASVKQVVALSTDKACAPVNLYGATKLCSDKLMLAGNGQAGGRDLRFAVVRYGNVWGSRGSVVPLWKACAERGDPLPVTHIGMSRFSVTMEQATDLVTTARLTAARHMLIPKAPSYHLGDLADAVISWAHEWHGMGRTWASTGIRPGEKMHESLITEHDVDVRDHGDYYTIGGPDVPSVNSNKRPGFEYRSDTNPHRLTAEELRGML